MLKELLIFELVLVIIFGFAIFYLIKRKKKHQEHKEITELKRKLTNAISVEKIPKMEEDQFVASPSSKKYHKLDCRLAKNIKNKEFGSVEEFKKKKYSSCGICLKK
jgi:superoxide dismutase